MTTLAIIEKFFVSAAGDVADIVGDEAGIKAKVAASPTLTGIVPVAENVLAAVANKYPNVSEIEAILMDVLGVLTPLVAKV